MTTTKPAWCYIAIDETKHWNIALAHHIERILTIYAFNRNAATHCCEFTPSYWLEAVAFQPIVLTSASDAERDSIYETVMGVSLRESSHYRHIRNVEAMIASHPKWFAEFTGDLDEPGEDDMNDAIQPPDEVFEQWNTNPKF